MLCAGAGYGGLLRLMSDQIAPQLLEQLTNYVHWRVSNRTDAEDLVQDILLKIISKPGPTRADKMLYWVFAIARNRVIDYYRAHGRDPARVSVERAQLIAEEETNPSGIEGALSGILGEMMGGLSKQDQQALRAVDLEGLSQKDYATRLGIDYSSAKSRVQRARKRLRRVVEQCCRIELDRRGAPIACEPKEQNSCC